MGGKPDKTNTFLDFKIVNRAAGQTAWELIQGIVKEVSEGRGVEGNTGMSTD